MDANVRLYRTDKDFAIVTDATEEPRFLEAAATALARLGANGNADADPDLEIRAYLPQVVDIACRLRGYKAPNVVEKRILSIGLIPPGDDTLFVETSGQRVVGVGGEDDESFRSDTAAEDV